MGFSDELKRENQEVWNIILGHPFIKELGSATLPVETFIYYIKQDYQYLIEFSRCIGLAASKADGIDAMRGWAQRMDGCLKYETEMLESLSRQLGIPSEDIAYAEKAPTNTSYVNHLLKVAYSGSLGEIVAALLPCMWTYMDVGKVLADIGGYVGHPLYEEWCLANNAPEYAGLVQSYKEVVDRVAEESGEYLRGKMREHFALSMRYECMFWDMAYNLEKWPVGA